MDSLVSWTSDALNYIKTFEAHMSASKKPIWAFVCTQTNESSDMFRCCIQFDFPNKLNLEPLSFGWCVLYTVYMFSIFLIYLFFCVTSQQAWNDWKGLVKLLIFCCLKAIIITTKVCVPLDRHVAKWNKNVHIEITLNFRFYMRFSCLFLWHAPADAKHSLLVKQKRFLCAF